MYIQKIIALVLLMPLVAIAAKPTVTQELEIPLPIATPRELISLFAPNKAIENNLLSVAICESNLNPNAIHYNDGGKGKHSVGIFQYQYSTFKSFSKLMGEDLDYYSYHDQIKLTSWIFTNYPQFMSHWTCSRIHHLV